MVTWGLSFWTYKRLLLYIQMLRVGEGRDTSLKFLPAETECPDKIDLRIYLSGVKVEAEHPRRALVTTPREFSVAPSCIPGAGLGVFSKTFLKASTWLGEYEGIYVPHIPGNKLTQIQIMYGWSIYRGGFHTHYVDASNISSSNWLRYVDCARHISEQNVGASMCYGRIHYRTLSDVAPGTELLVYYGPRYAVRLGINVEQYYNASSQVKFICNKSP